MHPPVKARWSLSVQAEGRPVEQLHSTLAREQLRDLAEVMAEAEFLQ